MDPMTWAATERMWLRRLARVSRSWGLTRDQRRGLLRDARARFASYRCLARRAHESRVSRVTV